MAQKAHEPQQPRLPPDGPKRKTEMAGRRAVAVGERQLVELAEQAAGGGSCRASRPARGAPAPEPGPGSRRRSSAAQSSTDGLFSLVEHDAVDVRLVAKDLCPSHAGILAAAGEVAREAGLSKLACEQQEVVGAMLKLDPEPDQFRALAQHPLDHRVELGDVVVRNHLDPMTRPDRKPPRSCRVPGSLRSPNRRVLRACGTSGRHSLASRIPPRSEPRKHGESGTIVPECANCASIRAEARKTNANRRIKGSSGGGI